jgi:molybdopterin-binding protein
VDAVRDGGVYMIPVQEVARLRAAREPVRRSAFNRFSGTITELEEHGLMSRVEMLVTGPVHLVAVITSEGAEQMNLKPGLPVTAVIQAISPYLLGADE